MNNKNRPSFRHLGAALALLPLIAACTRQPESTASPVAPDPSTGPQAESEVEPAETSFAQVLELQGVTFSVVSPNAASANTVTLSTTGLEIDNSGWSQEVDGIVAGSEVADLNADGSPEVYVYVKSTGADAKGSVVAGVANNRKSMSIAFMAPLSDTPGAADGYQGQDEFAVVEGVLARRFAIHDETGAPTGRMRQLQYKLHAGEAGWILKVDRVVEF
jgi:hypothetical protein